MKSKNKKYFKDRYCLPPVDGFYQKCKQVRLPLGNGCKV